MKPDKLTLGLDFGTTRIKATLADCEEVRPIYSIARSWKELGLDRALVCDWLDALNRIIGEIIAARAVPGGCGRRIRAIAVSATAPTLVLATSRVLADKNAVPGFSPLLNYDEHLHDYVADRPGVNYLNRRHRTECAISRLAPLTPSAHHEDLVLLSSTGLLTWYLTGAITMDYSTRCELGLSQDDEALGDACLPLTRTACEEPVAELRTLLCKKWGIRKTARIAAGSSDSFALAVGNNLRPGKGLAYLGTFCGLLQAKMDMSYCISYQTIGEAYSWHMSHPMGSTVERLAASWFPTERDADRRIEMFFQDAARQPSEESGEILYRVWRNNDSVRELPIVIGSVKDRQSAGIAYSMFKSFGLALRNEAQKQGIRELAVSGGLSANVWLTAFLEKLSGYALERDVRASGAEGAAVLAARALTR